MPGPETTVASIPSDNAIFDEERGVAKAAQCVSQVCRATRGGKTVEWSGCVPALTDPPQQIEQLELCEAERAITLLQKEQWSAILLVGLTRANYDQIASACDLAIGTIRSWLSRGRKTLRKLTGVAPPQHPRASRPRRLAASVSTGGRASSVTAQTCPAIPRGSCGVKPLSQYWTRPRPVTGHRPVRPHGRG